MNSKNDFRNIINGTNIPKENYCDQPYVVIRQDGAWVVCLTTGTGEEGATHQHVISSISYDKGITWSEPVDIEPQGPPESSWVMPYITDYGRIYAFYVYNRDNFRTVHYKLSPGYTTRVDTLGYMAYKYSDDGGASWSEERYYIPIRNFDIDNENPYEGKIQFFWGVGKPILHKDSMYMGFAKVGFFGEGFMEKDEGAFLRCPNINTEKDPEKLIWETLPEGTVGLRAPKGLVADEHNLVSLNNGDMYCTFRTLTGHNCQSYSHDDGKTWEVPEYVKYSPDGRAFKHPRAANFVRKYSNGKYTLWFHNHGKDLTVNPGMKGYLGRNPAWICGGVEKEGKIYWSQPEIVLYSKHPDDRISYPDFIEDDGEYYITETQKEIARVHHIPSAFMKTIWNHLDNDKLSTNGLLWEVEEPSCDKCKIPDEIIPKEGDGFAIQMILDRKNLKAGLILDGRNELKQGILVEYTKEDLIRIYLNDGERCSMWESDRMTSEITHVTVIVDGASGIISFILNDQLCDGGEERDYGFGRIDPDMKNISGKGYLAFVTSGIQLVRFYNRYILSAEAVGNFRYDKKLLYREKQGD